MVARRTVIKGVGMAAAAATTATTAAAAETETKLALGPYSTPWDPADPKTAGRQTVVPVPDDYFMPGRFARARPRSSPVAHAAWAGSPPSASHARVRMSWPSTG